jgi:hypothetical protein
MRFVEDASTNARSNDKTLRGWEYKRDVETVESDKGRYREMVENKGVGVCAER